MQPTLCSKCKKNVAVVFISRMNEKNEMVNEGLCLQCAAKLGLPQVEDMMKRMGITPEDLESLSTEMMQAFGGAEEMNDLPEGGEEDDEESGKTATFPFLNRLFGNNNQPAPQSQQPADSDQQPAGRKTEKKRKFLDNYCINLSQRARDGKLDAVIGREQEIERVVQILNRRQKNNPCLIGEPGVGKTAIAEGLAQRIVAGDVPFKLRDKEVYLLDLTALVAGTQFRGQFESRMKGLIEEIRKAGNVILVIDEVHNIVGAGDAEGSMNAANILKPALSRGEIQVIGATTFNEYRKHIEKDTALERRFQPVTVNEPNIEDTLKILQGIAHYYEQFHGVTIPQGVLRQAVLLSERYITDRYLPDKAIDLIDEAGAYRETHPLTTQKRQTVDRRLMGEILAKMCKIDAAALRDTSNVALQTLADDMRSEIFGQDRAVNEVVEAVQMAKAGLGDDDKPMASLLFVGPTGVGKTEVARTLARQLGVSLVRFDMSEYAEKHAVAKLIGAPAGYVGYEDGGQLTAALRKSPNCVLLFDEIEKAHPDIFNIFLQMMDYATLTDNHGQRADLRGTIIIMTSNAGAQYASRASIGFMGGVSRGDAMLAQVKKTFKPEFINRLTDIVVFGDMTRQMASLILDKKLAKLQQKLTAKNVTMHLADSARQLLLSRGFTPEYGAREIDRVIGSMLKPLLMRELLFGSLKKGGEVSVAESNGQLVINNSSTKKNDLQNR